MEAPASERTETAAPTQAAGAKTQAASAAPGAHDNLADPPADWPREGPFDDPTKPEKAYVEAAVRTALASKLGLAAEDDRVFAEAAPGGPASAADDKEAREMLRYLDEESALYAAGVAVDDTERELASMEAARRKAGAPPSKRPKGLESKAWKGGFFDTKRPAAKKKPFDKMRLLPPAPDSPGAAAAAPPPPPPWEELTGPQSAEEAAELEAEMAQLRVLAAAPAPARPAAPPAPAPAPAPAPPDAHELYERVQPGDPEAPGAARAPALDTLSSACIAKKKEEVDRSFFDVLAETAAARAGERRKRKESGGVEKGAAGTGATSLRPEDRPRFEPLDPASLPSPSEG